MPFAEEVHFFPCREFDVLAFAGQQQARHWRLARRWRPNEPVSSTRRTKNAFLGACVRTAETGSRYRKATWSRLHGMTSGMLPH